jgi:D-alanine-D-alanine ligase
VDPAGGPLTAAREAELLASGVGTAPPSLEALSALGGGSIPPALADWPAVREADVVFLALHGGQGEDGTLQALLDLGGLRYTGSGHLGSALAMDKHLSKVLFRVADVGTADWLMAPPPGAPPERAAAAVGSVRGAPPAKQAATTAPDGRHHSTAALSAFARRAVAELGLPVVVKPSKQGSTVGLSIVREAEALDPAIAEAFRYDDEVMVERFVPGRELTVGILGGQALPVIEIKPVKEIYDYECKYTKGMAEEGVADLPAETVARLHQQAQAAFDALKLRGYARIDFRMDEGGGLYCLEANTLPGMTELSLIPQAAAAAGILFPALCERIVELALNDR